MPLPRRSHRKARTGCLNCKKRRIKCDEDKPSCKNCSQHRVKCGYANSQAAETQRAASHVEPALSPQSEDNQNITEPSQPSQPSPYSNLHIPSSPSTHNDVTDLKLMHYFTTSTYQTLSDRREIQFLWQVQVPGLAFDHRFLLSIILSVAALDIDRKRAACSTIFAPYARHQYELSLQSSTHALTNVTPSNCHALYLFSALAFLFEIATSYGNKSLLYQDDTTLASWILHARGVRTIIGSSYHHLVSGILKPMFECKFLEEVPTNIELSLDLVVKHLRSAYPAQTLPAYLDAINELTKWSKVVYHGFSGWISQFADEYGSLLAGKDPFAIIIFAHACVLLKYGEPRSWIDRRPEAMVEEVHDLLEPSFRGWLRWPMKELAMRFRESPSTQVL